MRTLLVAVILAIAASGSALAQGTQSSDQSSDLGEARAATIERFRLTGAPRATSIPAVRRGLEELEREPCDKDAIVNLGKALQNAGFRREAANAHVRYSDTCRGHAPSLRAAVNLLLNLSDYTAATQTATDLIKLEPHGDNGYFLRALAFEKNGFPQRAIEDYATAIELFGDKSRIASVSYFAMARNFEKLGKPCDAIAPIEAWVALNPVRYDTSQTRAMIGDFMAKGKCPTPKGSEDVFPVVGGKTVHLAATINGVEGTFILDTGATFVSVKKAFADKAKIAVEDGSSMKLNTANGQVDARMGRAKSVQLKSLKADDVAVAVQTDGRSSYGDGVDGLLGMSFLSRFQVTMDAKSVRLKTRGAR